MSLPPPFISLVEVPLPAAVLKEMDLGGGLVGMESLITSLDKNNNGYLTGASSSSTYLKQRRLNHGLSEDNEWRCLKIPRTEPQMLPRTISQSLFSDGGEQMLSFSSSSPNDSAALPYYQPLQSDCPPAVASYMRSSGMVYECQNVNIQGVLARMRGPFTPSQWMELEHQALIYKYIDANHPIPPNLLIPLRRSLSPSGFSIFSTGSFRSNALGWGSFNLGFSGNADPEPGRCRRTDGKKWRCSRDAVADGKYCERHMNRGRHRSRKHVEGQNGHASKTMNTVTPSPSSTTFSGGTISNNNNTSITQQQLKRSMMVKDNLNNNPQDSRSICSLSNLSSEPVDSLFPVTKGHQNNLLEGTSEQTGLDLIPSTMFNASRNTYVEDLCFISSNDLNDQQTPSHHPLRRFFDDLPKVDNIESDRTQLSISIPMGFSDFSSPNSSPNQEKLTLSSLKLSREFDPIPMALGVGLCNEATQRQPIWNPVSWETSVGGPLGEVLTNTNSRSMYTGKTYSTSPLNLLPDGWDLGSGIASPTGVLQKTAFRSLSNSTGSSPRAEYPKGHYSTSSNCDDTVNPSTIHLL